MFDKGLIFMLRVMVKNFILQNLEKEINGL